MLLCDVHVQTATGGKNATSLLQPQRVTWCYKAEYNAVCNYTFTEVALQKLLYPLHVVCGSLCFKDL